MKSVIIDTGCIVALFDRSEKYHKQCVDIITQLDQPIVTCEAAITEACYLVRKSSLAIQAILQNVENNVFQIVFNLVDSIEHVKMLLKKYSDIPMDFTDACLVSLASNLNTGDILTLDKDFEVYRWDKNNKFKNLIEL